MARPRQRTPELRDTIIAAALTMCDRAGPDALTTRSVASAAGTSPAAIAELLYGKPGLLAAIAAEGFNRLDKRLATVQHLNQPERELVDLGVAYHSFSIDNHHVFDLMFSRPVHDFGAELADLDATRNIYSAFTTRFSLLLDAKAGHPTVVDSATGFVALLQGLAMQERSGILGSTPKSTDRRWNHGVQTFLIGTRAN